MNDTTTTLSPFHRGEREVQQRAGSRHASETIGRRMVRDFMPEQHRAFFPKLPFIVAGALDALGAPAATLLAGTPGFVSSPDPRRLRIDALPPAGDPLAAAIRDGAEIGLLGIELPTRRRNRANGRIAAVDGRGFDVDVVQSFGNCPKYIQTRERVDAGEASAPAQPPVAASRLDAAAAAWVAGADTFFVASASGAAGPGDAAGALGVDVSHRGGRPGFVRVDGDGVLTWPDFAGNGLFNTLGNLAVSPRAGLVFPDFAGGGLLHVSGRAEIVWGGAELDAFAGAERLVRLRIERVVSRTAALPWRWRLTGYSPSLEATGCW